MLLNTIGDVTVAPDPQWENLLVVTIDRRVWEVWTRGDETQSMNERVSPAIGAAVTFSFANGNGTLAPWSQFADGDGRVRCGYSVDVSSTISILVNYDTLAKTTTINVEPPDPTDDQGPGPMDDQGPSPMDDQGPGQDDPNSDRDGDGLTNQQESDFGSNPDVVDTDGGGKTDYEEYYAGTDPNDASDDNPIGPIDDQEDDQEDDQTDPPEAGWVAKSESIESTHESVSDPTKELKAKTIISWEQYEEDDGNGGRRVTKFRKLKYQNAEDDEGIELTLGDGYLRQGAVEVNNYNFLTPPEGVTLDWPDGGEIISIEFSDEEPDPEATSIDVDFTEPAFELVEDPTSSNGWRLGSRLTPPDHVVKLRRTAGPVQ